jgi:TolA-binding protein
MRLRGVIVVGAVLSITVGFIVGKTVIANSPVPGSSEDPVVSKSYVDKALEQRVGALEEEVAQLAIQAEALQGTINQLQNKVGSNSNTSTNTNSSTNSNTNTSTNSNNNSSTTPEKQTPPKSTDPADNKPESQPGGQTGDKPTTPVKTDVIGKTGYINASTAVRLRSAPTTAASIIKNVGKDEAMTIQKVENDWYNVKLADGTVGWIAGWYVDVK